MSHIEFLKSIEGAWDRLTPAEQESVHDLTKYFFFRNGKKNDDGSMGEIHISPKQFRDLLASRLPQKESK